MRTLQLCKNTIIEIILLPIGDINYQRRNMSFDQKSAQIIL